MTTRQQLAEKIREATYRADTIAIGNMARDHGDEEARELSAQLAASWDARLAAARKTERRAGREARTAGRKTGRRSKAGAVTGLAVTAGLVTATAAAGNAAAASRVTALACANPYAGACYRNAEGRMTMFAILAVITGLLACLLITGMIMGAASVVMPERYAAWRARMAEQNRQRSATTAQAARQAAGIREVIPPHVRRQVWVKSKGRCQHCGCNDAQARAKSGW